MFYIKLPVIVRWILSHCYISLIVLNGYIKKSTLGKDHLICMCVCGGGGGVSKKSRPGFAIKKISRADHQKQKKSHDHVKAEKRKTEM